MNFRLTIVAVVFLAYSTLSAMCYAVVELNEFSSEELRERYTALIDELRCPKCQNQNLAGSDSVVAVDLRNEVLLMLEEGNSDQQIRDFMQERYGDFILYNPPLSGKTLLVWVLPGLFFFFGVVAVFFIIRSATRNAALNTNDDADVNLDELDFNQEQEFSEKQSSSTIYQSTESNR